MKKLFTLLVLIILVGCKKTEPPAPVAPPMTHLDSAILGNWIMDSSQYYNNGVKTLNTWIYTDPVKWHLLLTSEQAVGDSYLWRIGEDGLLGSPGRTLWKTPSGNLALWNTTYTIFSYSPTKLVLVRGNIAPGGGQAYKYYLHK